MPDFENNVITAWTKQWQELFVEPDVFGTTNPAHIAHQLDDFCKETLHSAIADYLFYESSQGAVCGVQLEDGRRVVLKIHQASRSLEFLMAIYHVQHYLVNAGYPCTCPILAPARFRDDFATVEKLDDTGEYRDAHEPEIRRSIAQLHAWLSSLTEDMSNISGLHPATLDKRLPPDTLYPIPHSKMFDFEATSQGAEWIDALCRKARKTLAENSAGKLLLGHTDWSIKHFRYTGDSVHVIYDWDSLALDLEPVLVGKAAGGFTMTWQLDVPILPTQDEALAYVREYEAFRNKKFTVDEQQVMVASMTAWLCYGARIEHSVEPCERNFPKDSCRWILATYGSNFLSFDRRA